MANELDLAWVRALRSVDEELAAPMTTARIQPLTTTVSEGERNFMGNIVEAFSRGSKDVLADVAVYEALNDPTTDMEGALTVRKKLHANAVLDPIEGRFLTSLLYKGANTAGQMFESMKRAAAGEVVGAAIGGVTTGIISALFPTVGEEVPAIATGIIGGMKTGAWIGGHGTGYAFMYKQGAGSMYADMLEQGISPDIANKAARWGAIPYAAIELAEFKLLGAPFKKVVTGKAKDLIKRNALAAVTKAVSTYALTLAGEVAEEGAQEIVQIATEKTAEAFQEGGYQIDKTVLRDSAARVFSTMENAVSAFALLPIPGAAIEAGVAYEGAKQTADIQAMMNKVDEENTISPRDVTDPQVQLYISYRQKLGELLGVDETAERRAYEAYAERRRAKDKPVDDFGTWSTYYRSKRVMREQEKKRAVERKERLGFKVGQVRETSNAAEYTKKVEQALKGDIYTTLGITPLEGTLPVETFEALRQELVTNTKKLKSMEAYRLTKALENVYYRGGKFQDSDIKIAKKVWSPNVTMMLEEVNRLEEEMKRTGIPLREINDFARTVASSFDLSYVMHQNAINIGNPRDFFKTLAQATKIFVSDKAVADRINKEMLLTEEGQAAIRHGIRINEYGPGVGYYRGAEAWPSIAAQRIPGVARAQRGGAIPMNGMRIRQFGKIWRNRAGLGTDKEWADLAHIINICTGEGDAKALGKYAPMLNSVFFAPRLFISRVDVVKELFNPKLSWLARKYLMWNVVKFASINAGMLSMMSTVPGVTVEPDPLSTDFGKLKIGNTRIDFWGGYLPIFRTVYRLMKGKRKTAGGEIVDADMRDSILRFLQQKLGPLPAAVIDFWQGETFWGAKRDITDVNDITSEIYDKITPFFIQDLIDAVQYQGWGGAVVAPLGFFGAGFQTYPQTKSTQVALQRNALSMEVFGTKWDELGPTGQDFMRAKFPEIELMEREAQFDREHNYFMDTIEKNLKRSQKKVYNAMPDDVKFELDSLHLTLSGVNRRISSDWYLNAARYKQYEDEVIRDYKIVLTQLVRAPVWNNLNSLGKIEILKRVTEQIREGVRRKLIVEATVNDFKRIKFGTTKHG